MRRLFCLSVTSLLTACVSGSGSVRQSQDMLNQRFVGRSAHDFFLAYGKPAGQTVSADGILYRWVSIAPPPPPVAEPPHVIETPRGPLGFAPETGNIEPHYCEVQVATDRKNIIRRLTWTYDSIGRYSNSLCTEIFGG